MFDRENEFIRAERNSVIFFPNGQIISYPIENFVYLLNEKIQRDIIRDLLEIEKSKLSKNQKDKDFQSFLQKQFGNTLYHLYFEPYNNKVWRRPLSNVPIEWLEGKLPMPDVEEIIYNNFNRVAEKKFVHSSFYYEKRNGSQFIADRLADGFTIFYNTEIKRIVRIENRWIINGEPFDQVVFCGNIKDLPQILTDIDLFSPSFQYSQSINALQYHGTTSVFCEIDPNPYSWIYLPDQRYRAHRIICTGNFASSNNSTKRLTATIEFTDNISPQDILEDIKKMPLNPQYITHQFNPFTYPIQQYNTREMITSLKKRLADYSFFLTGRFADWEYYNVDVAMSAAMNMVKNQMGCHSY